MIQNEHDNLGISAFLFNVLYESDNVEDATNKEISLISQNRYIDKCYNLSDGVKKKK